MCRGFAGMCSMKCVDKTDVGKNFSMEEVENLASMPSPRELQCLCVGVGRLVPEFETNGLSW